MKLKPTAECISYLLRQVLEACEETGEDPTVRYYALREAIAYLNNVDFDRSDHVRIASDLHRIVREVTGNADPYREVKKISNRVALEWLSKNGRTLQGSMPFRQAISIAARGNMIDYGAMETTETPQALIDKAMDARIDSKKCWRLGDLWRKASMCFTSATMRVRSRSIRLWYQRSRPSGLK